MLRRQPEQTYASVVSTPPQVSRPITRDGPTPMEIESTQRRGPLSDAEKQRRRVHRLCLYCGRPGHIAVNCPHKLAIEKIFRKEYIWESVLLLVQKGLV